MSQLFLVVSNAPQYSPASYLQSDESSNNCYFRFLNLVDKYPENLVIGPYFLNHQQIQTSLRPCFPQKHEELLPIQRPSIMDIWTTTPSQFWGFPSFEADFHRWYLRMKSDTCLERSRDKDRFGG